MMTDQDRTAGQTMIADAPVGMAITEGPQHTLRLVNAAFCALQGKQAGEILGQPVAEAISGLGRESVLALLERVYGGEKSGSVRNLQYSEPGHSLRYKSYTVWDLPESDGRTDALVIQVTDFAEQNLANERRDQTVQEICALNHEMQEMNGEMRRINERLVLSSLEQQTLADAAVAAERRLRAMVQGLNAIICDVDALTGQWTVVGGPGETFLGYPLDRWTQEGFWKQVIHEDDYERAAASFQTGGSPGDGDPRAFRVTAADGATVWLRTILKAVTNEAGAVIKRRGILVDVTEQQSAYLALSRDLERNRAIAEALQDSLLWPQAERSFHSLKAAVFYEPALDDARVGGDLFDAFRLANGSILLTVGDVTGKGLTAAGRTGEIKFALRAFAQDYKDPADMIARLNRFLCDFHSDDALSHALVVLSLIVVDPITGAAQAASAGAEPPLILRASGAVEELPVRGLILGIDPKADYEATALSLEEGDMLLMSTDGITETRRGRDFFGSDRLLQAARRGATRKDGSGRAETPVPLPDVGKAILEAARAHGGGHFRDDICLLLVRRDPPGPR